MQGCKVFKSTGGLLYSKAIVYLSSFSSQWLCENRDKISSMIGRRINLSEAVGLMKISKENEILEKIPIANHLRYSVIIIL
jgi:hypothetical protein